MRVEEIMVGDWVQGFVPDSYSKIYGIFNEGRIAIIAEPNKTYIELSPEDVHPIPLTPEILEKNGLHETESNEYFPSRWVFIQDGSRDGVMIEITFYQKPVNGVNVLIKINTQSSKDCGINKLHSCDIETIHELQHALRLCGIEKEIAL